MPKSGDDMSPPGRTGAFVAAAFVATGASVEITGTVADGSSDASGTTVGSEVSVGSGTGLGASGGVTVAAGANVAGAAGRGVLVGVGVGPEAVGEQELNASPAAIVSTSTGQTKPAGRA